jgi:hypothetical protein
VFTAALHVGQIVYATWDGHRLNVRVLGRALNLVGRFECWTKRSVEARVRTTSRLPKEASLVTPGGLSIAQVADNAVPRSLDHPSMRRSLSSAAFP